MASIDGSISENIPNIQETSSSEATASFPLEQISVENQQTEITEIKETLQENVKPEAKKLFVEPSTKEVEFSGAGNSEYIQEYLPNFESYQEVIDKKKEVDGTLGLMLLSKKIKGDIPTID